MSAKTACSGGFSPNKWSAVDTHFTTASHFFPFKSRISAPSTGDGDIKKIKINSVGKLINCAALILCRIIICLAEGFSLACNSLISGWLIKEKGREGGRGEQGS